MGTIEESMARHPAGKGRSTSQQVVIRLTPEAVAVMRAAVDEAGWATNGHADIVLWQYLRLQGVIA